MSFKLEKTLLSEKITWDSKFIGLLSLAVLIVLFGVTPDVLKANGQMVFEQGQYWRAFTTTFVHADYKHLAHNAVFFTFLAVLLNNYFGNFVFPLLSILMGGIINLIVLRIYPQHIYLVGISGVVYFMGAFWLTLYLLIERTLPVKKRVIVATGLFLIFLAPEAVIKEEVSYLAHAVGFILGIPSALVFFRVYKEEIRSQEKWVEKKPEPVWVEEIMNPPEEDTKSFSDTPSQIQ